MMVMDDGHGWIGDEEDVQLSGMYTIGHDASLRVTSISMCLLTRCRLLTRRRFDCFVKIVCIVYVYVFDWKPV